MRIYLSESRRHGRRDAYAAIVEAMVSAGLAGATVFKGIGGFGSHRYISSADVSEAYVDLPVVIEVVDTDERVRAFIPQLEAILDDGLVTLERVQTIFYRADPS